MKRIIMALALSFAMAGLAHADPIEGVWKTEPDANGYSGHVKIAPCGKGFCGTLIASFDPKGVSVKSPHIGKQIPRGMVPAGGGKYKGKMWVPSRDKIFSANVTLLSGHKKLKGCVALGLICQTWTRVK